LKLQFYILTFFLIVFGLAACVPTRHLKGNEKLLYDVTLNGVKFNEEEQFEVLYRQKPNRKIPLIGGTPYLSVYYFGKGFYKPAKIQHQIEKNDAKYAKKIQQAGSDSAKIQDYKEKREKHLNRLNHKKENGNWFMRSVGEPPAIYDSAKTVETVSQINTYLISKGFFNNKVSFKTKERKKKVYLTIDISENKPHRITELTTQIPDSAILRIVNNSRAQSNLKLGQNYDEYLIGQERDRLEILLRNQGYYEFRKLYISFDVDTTKGNNSVQIATIIENPSDSTSHKAFTIRNIYFVEDAALNRFGVKRDTVVYRQINFLAYKQWVSPKMLSKKIRITPGQRYNLQRTGRTQRQLTDLDVYRYVTVNYEITRDSLEPKLDAFINVMPSKRLQEYTEIGGNVSTYASARIIPLPFFSERLKVRNVFGGAENMEIGLRAGLEGQPSTSEDKVVTTTELGGNIAFYFPQFLIPFYRNEAINLYNPRTRVNAAYTYTDRPDYTRTNLEFTMDYYWQRTQRLQYVISPIDISLVNVQRISEAFDQRLKDYQAQGFPLIESFRTSVVSSLNGSMIYNSNNINQTRDAAYFKLFAEIGDVPRVLSNGNLSWFPDWINGRTDRYRAYSFAKFNADYRKYIKFKEKLYLVGRLNAGAASPFPNTNEDILPYDKFFFSGGGSSIRAWRPRKLGPGSFAPPYRLDSNGEPLTFDGFPVRNYDFEQPGEIILESNLEVRFNIFSYLNGALFMDAGNIWTVDKDPARPGARFSTNFLSELAVATGFGLRFDFSFLIVRIDMATKMFDPAEPRGERYVLNRFRLNGNTFKAFNTQNSFNLGIGYPF
jgi:outer membrane protein insertion porin family